MTRDLSKLTGRTFDVLVIGGGITGACMAHDAALRGLSVALVDKGDFGAATSAASSKLLHGGIRYLQQGQPGKVRESAAERLVFVQVAPHLVRWVPFLIPTKRSLTRGRMVLGAGLLAYRALQLGVARSIRDSSLLPPGEHLLSRREILDRYPLLGSLPDLTGAWMLHEAHMRSSERMTLSFIKSAVQRGAAAANYVEVRRFLRHGDAVVGVEALDRPSGRTLEIAARVVANASGPWIGMLNAPLTTARLEREVKGYSKGVHIVTRALFEDVAVALATHHQSRGVLDRSGRHLFVIPWRGHSLIGTTNVPFCGTPDQVRPTADDISRFVVDLNGSLPGLALATSDVQFAFAGLYPITAPVLRPDVYQGSGRYQLVDHAASGGPAGLVSVLGAKYTTARRLAERATDLVFQKLHRQPEPCTTRTVPLVGGDIDDLSSFVSEAQRRYGDRLDPAGVEHLVGHYGREIDEVLPRPDDDPAVTRLVASQPTIEAEVRYAVEREMALYLDDIVFRRTGLGNLGPPGEDALARVATIASDALGWDAGRRGEELKRVATYFEYV